MAYKGKAAVVVMDGFGLEPSMEWTIVEEIYNALPDRARTIVDSIAANPERAKAMLAPTGHGVTRILAAKTAETDWTTLFSAIRADRQRLLTELSAAGLAEEVHRLRLTTSHQHHYAPWAAETPFLNQLRQDHPTWITRTAGVYTGHVDMNPEIMGNSDTGHQQIFNLAVARQIPAFLTHLIETGEFFKIESLNQDLLKAQDGATVVFKTLLSGEQGDDGFVHSAWPHMEAFFKLYFEELQLPAARLQIEAVLDGRDSPYYSSMRYEEKNGAFRYGFLRKLRRLLRKYNAEQSLRWVMGRQFMDRDYKGNMIRTEYEMLTSNKGRFTNCIDAAFDLVENDHAAGFTDSEVEPIIIGHPVPVGDNTVFFNCIFRADRQEPITAALAGTRNLILSQAGQKRRLNTWDDLSWLKTTDGLTLWAMIDYHDDLKAAGVKSVYQDSPHPHNVLHLLNEAGRGFRFLFLTEGVKEKHMGLFSRGRRSTPLSPAEAQTIIPTYGAEDGINSDNDLYKVPMMKHPEIALELTRQLTDRSYDIIAANFPGTDMIGHLIENHFDACLKTLQSLDMALRKVVSTARQNGWLLVLTADHGNVEHYGPDHGNNDVLTTTIFPDEGGFTAAPPANAEARLFDISWTLLEGLGATVESLNVPPYKEGLAENPRRLVGASLVRRVKDPR
jgi:2,3-bisphosphoglycerate-independent phosphoglycerate mutase